MSNFYATIHRDTHWVLHQYFNRTSGPSWQSCWFNQLHGAEPGVSPLQGPVIGLQKFTEEDLLVFCNTHRLHLWTRLAELRVSINFKERNLGFRPCKDQQLACRYSQPEPGALESTSSLQESLHQ